MKKLKEVIGSIEEEGIREAKEVKNELETKKRAIEEGKDEVRKVEVNIVTKAIQTIQKKIR